MQWPKALQQRPWLLLLPILLVAFGLRLHSLASQSLWWDELKTIDRATLAWPALVHDFVVTKDQLPFYYLLMRGWVWLGRTAFVVRFFSVGFGLLCVAGIYQLGRRVASSYVGVTAAFLLAISPFHIWYSQETRMYSLLTFLIILAHLGLIYLLQGHSKWYWALYLGAMVTAVYTHYFAFLILLAHALFFVLYLRPLKPISTQWFAIATLLGIAFVPWIFLIGGRTGYSEAVPTWINPTRWLDPLQTFWTFSVGPLTTGTGLAGAIVSVIFITGLVGWFTKGRSQIRFPAQLNRLLIFWSAVPLLIVYLVSLTGSLSLYVDRYLIISLPPFLLFVSWGWVTLTRRHPAWLWAIVALTFALTLPSLVQLYSNPAQARSDWRATFAVIAEGWQPEDVIIGTRDVQLPLGYYGRSTMPYIELPPPETTTITAAFAQAMAKQLDGAAPESQRFWFIEPFYVTNAHGWTNERNQLVASPPDTPHHHWLGDNLALVNMWRFPGVRLTLYEKDAQP